MLPAVKKTLTELQTPASNLLHKLERVGGADVGAFGFKFGFKLDSVGAEGGTTLAQALTEVVDQARTDVVLIVDEVQHAITTLGNRPEEMLKALRQLSRHLPAGANPDEHLPVIAATHVRCDRPVRPGNLTGEKGVGERTICHP